MRPRPCPDEVVSIVNKIHAVNPETHVLVAQLRRCRHHRASAPAWSVCARRPMHGIASAVHQLEVQGQAVSLVDTSSVTQADLIDGIHLTPAGYQKLAGIWFDAIQDEVPHPGAVRRTPTSSSELPPPIAWIAGRHWPAQPRRGMIVTTQIGGGRDVHPRADALAAVGGPCPG